MASTVDFSTIVTAHQLASQIANQWNEWNIYRRGWLEEKKELRNYLYATDTRTTANAVLPWSNTTTTPKLTQIMDNLHANYFATLFPQQKWMRWEALDKESDTRLKRDLIQAYMDNKVRQSNFVNTCSDLIYDWIQYGNCFATVEFQREYIKKENGDNAVSYVGPRLVRVSPYDIAFNPTAGHFDKSPKIIRSLYTLGDIKKMVAADPTNAHFQQVFTDMLRARAAVNAHDATWDKADGYVADGFSSIQQYYGSAYVEVLTFYGDIYDYEQDQFYSDRVITVVDRAHVISNVENPAWNGKAPIFHVGWRDRPDNLYSMGPLDNLVGMQYRIDHLENLKADVFDQIAYPIMKIKGEVEDFDFQPGSRIYIGEEGDVAYLVPDATALNADLQIQVLEQKMEEMAGAPKQAMGIRTPGEKTAFEVQTLQNSASRIFEHKAAHFERVFIEPILNQMLEVARRNLDLEEQISIKNEATGENVFRSITKKDILGNGKIVPVGARHFAEKARRVQNLQQLVNLKQDQTIGVHVSGKEIARIISDELGEPNLFGENVAIKEQMETQTYAQDAEADQMEQLAIAQEQGL